MAYINRERLESALERKNAWNRDDVLATIGDQPVLGSTKIPVFDLSAVKAMTPDPDLERYKASIRSAAITEFADRLTRYYEALKGESKTFMVAYHIEQIKNDLLKGGQQ